MNLELTEKSKLIPHSELCDILGMTKNVLHAKKDKLKDFWLMEKADKRNGRVMWDLSRIREIQEKLYEPSEH